MRSRHESGFQGESREIELASNARETDASTQWLFFQDACQSRDIPSSDPRGQWLSSFSRGFSLHSLSHKLQGERSRGYDYAREKPPKVHSGVGTFVQNPVDILSDECRGGL
jgi:hypothetical protein